MFGGGAIARLRAVIGLDDKDFVATTKRVKKDAGSLEKTMSGVGSKIKTALSVGAIIAWGKTVFTTFAAIAKQAENLNISTRKMLGLNELASQAGLKSEQMQEMLAKIASRQLDVARGNEAAEASLKAFGITAEQFVSVGVDEALLLVAKAATEAENPVAHLGKLIGEEVGKRGLAMMNALAKEGIPEVTDALVEATKAVGDLDDRWNRAKFDAKAKSLQALFGVADFIKNAGTGSRNQNQAFGIDMTGAGISEFSIQDKINPIPAKKADENEVAQEAEGAADIISENLRVLQERIKAEKNATIDAEVERLNSERERLVQQGMRAGEKGLPNITGREISADDYQRVGGQLGGGHRADVDIADRTIRMQEQQLQQAAETAKNTAEIAVLTRSIEAANSGRIQ